MTKKSDRQNCLNNLVAMVLADGEVQKTEAEFLQRAAGQLQIDVPDWGDRIRQVKDDGTFVYPVSENFSGKDVFKAMVAMARSDGHVDDREKKLLLTFAKSIEMSRPELKSIWSDSAADDFFRFPGEPQVTFLVITTDFEKIDDLLQTLRESRVSARKAEYKDALHGDAAKDITVVCLHGARDVETTVKRCNNLLHRRKQLQIVPILGRYQGNQVKYLHEIGVKRCIVEPVFVTDIANILKDLEMQGSSAG